MGWKRVDLRYHGEVGQVLSFYAVSEGTDFKFADASMHLPKATRALLQAHDAQKRTKVRRSVGTDFFK